MSVTDFQLADRQTDRQKYQWQTLHYNVSLLWVTNSKRTCRAASSQLKNWNGNSNSTLFSVSENSPSCEKSILFRTKLEETDDICLTGGWIKLKENHWFSLKSLVYITYWNVHACMPNFLPLLSWKLLTVKLNN